MTIEEISEKALTDWCRDNDVPLADVSRIFDGIAGSTDGPAKAPYQDPAILCPGLTALPWHDPSQFPWVADLERAYSQIKHEFSEEYAGMSRHPESAALAVYGSWKTFYLFQLGRRYDANHDRCPETSKALACVPGVEQAGMAYFSVMAPNTAVKPHCGFINTRIRCHLGLVVPDDCEMTVGGEARHWEEGRCLVFDDSFEHAVVNNSDSARAVLLLDTWHPELAGTERRALAFLAEVWRENLD